MTSMDSSSGLKANVLPTIDAEMQARIDKAAELILNCDAILFTSGAGMGVGSGLGTFRGIGAGVWPPLLKHPELDFTDMSNPQWFEKPEGNSDKHNTANFGYAFWAYRYNAYTSAAPHVGYQIAKQWSQLKNVKFSFSFTSNIDGHWIKSGWNISTIVECHGSVHHMQCVSKCSEDIWNTDNALNLDVDPKTDCATDRLPQCHHCKKLARPNVLMFWDWQFLGNRLEQQRKNYKTFQLNIVKEKAKLLIIELGAGTAVPTVRMESENAFTNRQWSANFIRINPFEEHSIVSPSCKERNTGESIELALDALKALSLINEAIKKKSMN